MIKRKIRWPLVIIAIVVFIIVVVFTVLRIEAGRKDKQIKEKLELAEHYLIELDYAQAVVAYKAVLDIAPMSAEGLAGLHKSYLSWAQSTEETDLGESIRVLEEELAYMEKYATDHPEVDVKEMILEVREQIEKYRELQAEEEEEEEEELPEEPAGPVFPDDYSQLWDMMMEEEEAYHSAHGCDYGTYDMLEEAYRPMIELLEQYIPELLAHPEFDKGADTEFYGYGSMMYYEEKDARACSGHDTKYPDLQTAWSHLVYYYMRVSDMEKALETRNEYAHYCNRDDVIGGFSYSVYKDEYDEVWEYAYDEYGRQVVVANSGKTDFDGLRVLAYYYVFWEGHPNNYKMIYNQYDEYGRFLGVSDETSTTTVTYNGFDSAVYQFTGYTTSDYDTITDLTIDRFGYGHKN